MIAKWLRSINPATMNSIYVISANGNEPTQHCRTPSDQNNFWRIEDGWEITFENRIVWNESRAHRYVHVVSVSVYFVNSKHSIRQESKTARATLLLFLSLRILWFGIFLRRRPPPTSTVSFGNRCYLPGAPAACLGSVLLLLCAL